MNYPISAASAQTQSFTSSPRTNSAKWLTPAFLLLGLNLASPDAFAFASYSAGAFGTLNFISITDSQGNLLDNSNVILSVNPDSGPYVSAYSSGAINGASVSVDGVAASNLATTPDGGNNLDQGSQTQGVASEDGSRAVSSHGTEGNLLISLINGLTDTYTLTFELRYSAFATALASGSRLVEYANAYADFLLFDSLAQLGTGIEKEFNFGVNVQPGSPNQLSDSYSDTILFSINLDPTNFVDSFTLRTFASGDTLSVPVPATAWLFTLGLGLMGIGKYRKS